jgi:hypothetical protein
VSASKSPSAGNDSAPDLSPDVVEDFQFVRDSYAPDVKWSARGRGLECRGREAILRLLSREAAAMQEPEFTLLRRSSSAGQSIEEFAIRFVYTGSGIDNAPIAAGDVVELKRVRIRELAAGLIRTENCIENWTVLERKGSG